jgi:hypothetical protein
MIVLYLGRPHYAALQISQDLPPHLRAQESQNNSVRAFLSPNPTLTDVTSFFTTFFTPFSASHTVLTLKPHSCLSLL